MENYSVRIYSIAKKDLTDIVDYITTLSPTAAIRQYDSVIEKIGTLKQMPQRCAYLNSDMLRAKGYRGLSADNYTVFFKIKGNTVQIRRILYGARNYEFLL